MGGVRLYQVARKDANHLHGEYTLDMRSGVANPYEIIARSIIFTRE
jgi:hypothetical protein